MFDNSENILEHLLYNTFNDDSYLEDVEQYENFEESYQIDILNIVINKITILDKNQINEQENPKSGVTSEVLNKYHNESSLDKDKILNNIELLKEKEPINIEELMSNLREKIQQKDLNQNNNSERLKESLKNRNLEKKIFQDSNKEIDIFFGDEFYENKTQIKEKPFKKKPLTGKEYKNILQNLKSHK